MNKFAIIYINVIFKMFQFGINSFYKSEQYSNSNDQTYNQMLRMKQTVYTIFNFLTKSFTRYRNEYLSKIIFNNFPIFIRPLVLSDIVMTSNAWEPYVKRIFSPESGDTVIDIGAHIGTYTIPIAFKVGKNGKVIAFEPHPNNFVILKKNMEVNELENIVILEKAVGDKNEFVHLTLSDDPMLSMIVEKKIDKSTKIETVRLDTVMNDLSLKTVNWLKIDAEGYEIHVLEGARTILERFHPKIIIEVRKENQTKIKEILSEFQYTISYLGGEYFIAT